MPKPELSHIQLIKSETYLCGKKYPLDKRISYIDIKDAFQKIVNLPRITDLCPNCWKDLVRARSFLIMLENDSNLKTEPNEFGNPQIAIPNSFFN